MSENSAFEEEIKEVENKEKRRHAMTRDARKSRLQSSLFKGILLSLTKPSYTLKTSSKNIRTTNRARLRRLLSRLVRRRNWEEASGVLSVLLKGTVNEKSPATNRTKYWVAMELIKHINGGSVNSTKIQHVYEIWMKRIGSMNNWPIKDRFMVQLEFILFCLREGNVGDAHQTALCLMQQREFGSDPISNMVVGLTFCQLWHSTIPKELQFRNSNGSYTPMQSDMEMRVDVPIENSEGHDTVIIHQVASSVQADSDTSVRNDKEVARDVDADQHREVSMEADDSLRRETTYQNHQSQGFYMNATEDSDRENSPVSNCGGNIQYAPSSIAHGLDSWLFPFRLSHPNKSLEDVLSSQREMLNHYYKGAVKHLRLALYSKPPVYEALLPLIQMLLLVGHIDEAVNELEKFSHSSQTALPLRAKTSILEQFGSDNSVELSTCFEEILKKDPTCRHSLGKLISMHQNGDYSPQQLLEMIALHLDATTTYAECNTWKQFSSCFLKLHSCEEDRMSTCLNGSDAANKQAYSGCFRRISKTFTDGISGKTWRFRCRWWLTRHFSHNLLRSEIEAGDFQLLTYKASSASHMYGPEFEYVVEAYKCLKDRDQDLFLFLKMHTQNSLGVYLDSSKT